MLKIDSLSHDSNSSKATTSVNGLAINSLYAPTATLSCLKASELTQNRILYLALVRINLNREIQEATMSLTEEIYVEWNPAFHLTIIEFYEKFAPKLELFKVKKLKRGESYLPVVSIHVKLDGKISIGALLSNEGHQMCFVTETLSFSVFHANSWLVKTEHGSLDFDKNKIFIFEVSTIVKLVQTKDLLIIFFLFIST